MMTRADAVAAELEALGALGAPSFANGRSTTPHAPLPDADRQMIRELAARTKQKAALIEAQLTALASHLGELRQFVEGMETLAALTDDEADPDPVAPVETEAVDAAVAAEETLVTPQEAHPDG